MNNTVNTAVLKEKRRYPFVLTGSAEKREKRAICGQNRALARKIGASVIRASVLAFLSLFCFALCCFACLVCFGLVRFDLAALMLSALLSLLTRSLPPCLLLLGSALLYFYCLCYFWLYSLFRLCRPTRPRVIVPGSYFRRLYACCRCFDLVRFCDI